MAKSRRRRESDSQTDRYRHRERDTFDITNRRLRRDEFYDLPHDRRDYYPEPFDRQDLHYEPVRTRSGSPARIVYDNTTPVTVFPLHNLRFAVGSSVPLCQRREQRRSVLHALGIAGSGMKMRKRRKGRASDISCK